jgi:hypothetical protein
MLRVAPRVVLVAVIALVAAGCSCGGDASTPADADTVEAALATDAAYPDAPPGEELCARGIRRVDVPLPAITTGSNPDRVVSTSRAVVDGGEVLAARVDQLGNAQLVRVDASDGHVIASGVGPLPSAVDAVQAFRRLPSGDIEVLASSMGGLHTTFYVATFGNDAVFRSAIEVILEDDPRFDELQFVVGALPTPRGFVALARGESSTTGDARAVLVDIEAGVGRLQSALPWSGGSQGGNETLASADGRTLWVASAIDYPDTSVMAGARVARFDASVFPFDLASVDVPILRGAAIASTLRIDALSDGTAVLGASTSSRTVLDWIDADLTALGEWSYPTDQGAPMVAGAAGSLGDEAILFRLDDQVRLARAFGPGAVAGGLRPLLDGVTTEVGYFGPHDGFGASGDAFVLATWAPDLSLVTFCGAP